MKAVTQKDLFAKNVEAFLDSFKNVIDLDIERGIRLDFEIVLKSKSDKLSPILKLAKPEEAGEIVEICKNAYENTYPYKEFEDESQIRERIKSSNFKFILFKDEFNNNMGCFMCNLCFKEKKGYMGGFMIKKEYQGKLDIVKSIIGSYIWMWNTYKNCIALWYCENRTAHATSQYITSVCGIKTVAILPNKDTFFSNVESDVLGVIYNEDTLRKMRRKDFPKLIPEISNCFQYSNKKFNLGPVEFNYQSIELKKDLLEKLRSEFVKSSQIITVGYEKFTFSYKKSDSFFQLIYTPWLNNIEKIEYKVKNLEELAVFIEELQKLTKIFNIRYVEVYVSAYEPLQQKLFCESGLSPRGYVPSWKYNAELDAFEDYILFNHYKSEIKNIILLPEGLELLEVLNLDITY